MPPAGALGCGRSFQGGVDTAPALAGFRHGGPGRRLPDSIGQVKEVIGTGTGRAGRHRQPQHFPAARDGQGPGVLLTQVVAVRLGKGRQRPQNSGGVGIDVRQSGHR